MKATEYISGGNFLCFIAESLKATDGNRESKAKETKEISIDQSSADKVQSVGRQRRVVGKRSRGDDAVEYGVSAQFQSLI